VLATHLIEHAKGQGYHRTEVSDFLTRALAPGLVELTGAFVRYEASQSEIARFGITYIVRGGTGQWRIVVAVAHEAVMRGVNYYCRLASTISAGEGPAKECWSRPDRTR
jgi:hypothetical protein